MAVLFYFSVSFGFLQGRGQRVLSGMRQGWPGPSWTAPWMSPDRHISQTAVWSQPHFSAACFVFIILSIV